MLLKDQTTEMGSLESELGTVSVQSKAGLRTILFHERNIRKKGKYRLNNWNLITQRYQWGVIDNKILNEFISYPSQQLIHKEKRRKRKKKEKKGRKKEHQGYIGRQGDKKREANRRATVFTTTDWWAYFHW